MSNVETPPLESPSSTATQYKKALIGFGVWFVVGLAPLLGVVRVPLFSALIDLYPESIRLALISISGILMGMMAVVVEFSAGQKVLPATVRKWFYRGTIVFVVSLFLLIVAYYFTVVHVTYSTGHTSIITGTLTVPADKSPSCTCVTYSPAQECVEGGTSEAAIRACFGPNRVAFATLALSLLYLVVMGAFAAAVGLLLLSRNKS